MTRYEYYDVNDDVAYVFASSADDLEAQSFTVGTVGANKDHTISNVKLLIYRKGSPGTFNVSIKAVDGAGKPTGSALSSGSYDGDTITTNAAGEWITITMSSYILLASTKYSIICSGTGDGSNWIAWRADSSSPTYTGGQRMDSSDGGSSWNAQAHDFMFEVNGIKRRFYTAGEKELKTDWPHETGLTARTTKQTGRQMNLLPQGLNGVKGTVWKKDRKGID